MQGGDDGDDHVAPDNFDGTSNGDKPTYRTLVAAFTDFLTVAIHTILYERSIYPRPSFLSASRFNFAVRQSRHPKVCQWINGAVAAAECELCKGVVGRIAVVLHAKDNAVLERYVFDVSRFPSVPASEIDTKLEQQRADGEEVSVLPSVDMEEQFRACMSQLTSSSAALTSLPKGCSFTIAIELKPNALAPIGHPQPWIPIERSKRPDEDRGLLITRPIRTATAGALSFEMWIEQATASSENG